jgi:hypothetical protein
LSFLRIATCLAFLVVLTACQKNDLKDPPVPLGDFALGLNIVVADQAQKSPVSRTAQPEEWKASLETAIKDRFGRYENTGSKRYNLGISVDGYALAPPGIPIILKPRSLLVITANIWDDAARKKLNPEGKRLIIFENTTGKTIISSGLTQSRNEQMRILSYNAAKSVEGWLLDNPQWFGLPPKPKTEVVRSGHQETQGKGTSMSAPHPDPTAIPPLTTGSAATAATSSVANGLATAKAAAGE